MADYILEMKNIVKEFSGVRALSNVNLSIERGEIHALCGENGAGKSTLMNVLSGLYPHGTYEGEIYYEGELCKFKDLRDSEEKGIVIIHQELALSPYLSIKENIFLGNEQAKNGIIDWDITEKKTDNLLKTVGLRLDPNTLVSQIGVGQQQLVEIAKAFSKSVRLLILDEPTAALNEEESANLLELIKEFRNQGITSIIISSSYRYKSNRERRPQFDDPQRRNHRHCWAYGRGTNRICDECLWAFLWQQYHGRSL